MSEQLTITQALSLAAEHHDAGRQTEADAIYWRVLQSDPRQPDAWNLIGVLAHDNGRHDIALVMNARAIELLPTFGHYHNCRGKILIAMGRHAEALKSLEWAKALDASCHTLWNNLGTAYKALDRPADAVAAYGESLKRKPKSAVAYANLCSVYYGTGEIAKAIDAGRRAVELAPEWPDAHWNLALVLLADGQFEQGWREYEWRWRVPSFSTAYIETDVPQWRGEDLRGKTVLVWAEQGAGDAIMCARYLPELRRRGVLGVFVRCGDALARLIDGMRTWPTEFVVTSSVPDVDYHVPMMSLPGLLGVSGSPEPYIRPPVAESFALDDVDALRVGLCWAGNPGHSNDRHRSLPVSALDVLRCDGAAFYSLQHGVTPPGWMTDLMPRCHDYADTAAIIANLDLVITVDTSVAHLAGAMGKPVWVILPECGVDWRWGTAGERTPWYPSARLFRGGAKALERVAVELRSLVAESRPLPALCS